MTHFSDYKFKVHYIYYVDYRMLLNKLGYCYCVDAKHAKKCNLKDIALFLLFSTFIGN